jgi:membrane protease subunit HflC
LRDRIPNFDKRKVAAGMALVVGALLLMIAVLTGKGGFVTITDTEVAVIVNYINGEEEIVNRPGYKIFPPFFAQAFKFDKSPNQFLMEGDRDLHSNHVSKLTVRANDGSNFWFETLEIQYKLMPGSADLVLNDSGPGEAFKNNWVRSFARSILRDEFGKFSAEEVADPSNYRTATIDAQLRLNELLAPHGIEITEIITPKPKFEDRYERAIEDRKVADQEVEKLRAQAIQLERERERRLAGIERDKATDYELLLGQLEESRIRAEKDAVKITRDADAFKIQQIGQGTAMQRSLTHEARGREESARKEAEGLRARVDALAARGDILVRETLAGKFRSILFEIVPYRRDPAPIRIEHMGAVPGGIQQ